MSGGGSSKTTIGYRYAIGLDMKLCYGPINSISRFQYGEKTIYSGNMPEGEIFRFDQENAFGGEEQEGGIRGFVQLLMGYPTQPQNDYLVSQLGEDVPAYRGVVSFLFRNTYIGTIRYLRSIAFRCIRTTIRQNGIEHWYVEKAEIGALSEFQEITYDSVFEYMVLDYVVDTSTPEAIAAIEIPANGYDLTGQAPFGRAGTGGSLSPVYPINTLWTYDTSLILRKSFFINQTTLDIQGYVENGAGFFLDGELVYSVNFDNDQSATASGIPYSTSIPITPGYHELHILVLDEAGGNNQEADDNTYFYVEIANASGTTKQYADMNPAHIIYECLTDPDWGMGYPEADIDDDAFRAAADTLYFEGLGMSIIWDKQKQIQDFIEEVLRTIDASLFISRTTGKFILKLIRQDYEIADLITLNEDNVSDVSDYSRANFGELVNSIYVVYNDLSTSSEESVVVQDPALVQQQGGAIDTTIQYPGISNNRNAARLAERDLATLSKPGISCVVLADRNAASLNPGDPFILDWPELEINNMVMRAQTVAYGDGRNNVIKIQCVEDAFETPLTPIIGDPDLSEEPDSTPQNAFPVFTTEIPYWLLVQNVGDLNAQALVANEEDLAYFITIAGKPAENHVNADLYFDVGSGYGFESTFNFAPYGFIYEEYDAVQTSFTVSDSFDLEIVEVGTFCQVGEEIMVVNAIFQDSAEQWQIEVGRGCLDTTPRPGGYDSGPGGIIIFWSEYYGGATTEFTTGETVLAKVLTNTGDQILLLGDATVTQHTARTRLARPYPPGNLQFDGESYPEFVGGDSADNVLVTWAHRDRVQQSSTEIFDHTEGDIGPEAGTTYRLELLDETESLVSSVSGISGTEQNVDLSMVLSPRAMVRVYSERDGLESWMPAEHTFSWNYISSVPIDSAASFDSAGDSTTDGLVWLADLTIASYDSVSVSVSGRAPNPTGLFFSPDGLSMFIVGATNDRIDQFTLSTAWVVSTATYASLTLSVAAQNSVPRGLCFSDDGTKAYMIGSASGTVGYQYTLPTPWSLSGASYSGKSLGMNTQDSVGSGLRFRPDGLKMYMTGITNGRVFQYSLSTAWDISTAIYDSVFLDVNTEEVDPTESFFSPNGDLLYIVGQGSDTVDLYTLSTAWDLSTAIYSGTGFSVATQSTTPRSLFFTPTGDRMFILEGPGAVVYQYTSG